MKIYSPKQYEYGKLMEILNNFIFQIMNFETLNQINHQIKSLGYIAEFKKEELIIKKCQKY